MRSPILASAFLASAAFGALAEEPGTPGFLAEHVMFGSDGRTPLYSAHVEVSTRGLRAMNLRDGRESIADFSSGKLWVVDRTRQVFHEIPLRRITETAPFQRRPVATSSAVVGALFAPMACQGRSVGNSDRVRWRGRHVQRSDCTDEQGDVVATHWFDDDAGMVVRVEDRVGHAEELQRLRSVRLSDERFRPPAHYRAVGLEQFTRRGDAPAAYAPPLHPPSPQQADAS